MPDIFQYNPLTQLFHQRGTSDEYLVDLQTLTGGRYYVTGNQIRDSYSQGNPVVSGIPTLRDASIVKDEGGNVWVTVETQQKNINKVKSGIVRWSGEISSIVMPDGTIVIPSDAQFGIAPYSTRLYIRTDPITNDRQYLAVPYDPATGESTIVYPSNYRLATPREALEYGAAGWLASRGKDIVAQAIAQGINDDEGEPITKFTDAAIWLAAQITVTAGRTTKLV